MYCGSCLRDNALAAELLRRGHDVVLTPVYTPTKTDETNVSGEQVFFGGISVFLEQHSALFRHTPRFLDKLWDSSWALRLATRRQIKVDAKSLGEMTVSMLKGSSGFQAKEIDKLLEWLRDRGAVRRHQPAVFAAARARRAAEARAEGADLLHAAGGRSLSRPARRAAPRAVDGDDPRRCSAHVDAFLPVSRVLPRLHARLPGHPGVEDAAGAARASTPRTSSTRRSAAGRPVHDRLLRAHRTGEGPSRARRGLPAPAQAARHRTARGCWPPATSPPEHQELPGRGRGQCCETAGLGGEFEYRGELDRAAKVAFLHELDVLSVPTTYQEPKGLFLMEAMASGVPVVQPRRGAFPEIIEKHRRRPDRRCRRSRRAGRRHPGARSDPRSPRRSERAGAAGVRQHYTVARMADQVEACTGSSRQSVQNWQLQLPTPNFQESRTSDVH